MYIIHFKAFIDLSILLEMYAKLFKIPLTHIGEFASGKSYLYEYYAYPAGEFCSIFRIYASTPYTPELDFNLQEIQLASDISKILQQDVMTVLPNADSPYMWLLVRGEQYFAVAELFVDKFTNDEENDYGICLDYSTQKQISFPKLVPSKQKENSKMRVDINPLEGNNNSIIPHKNDICVWYLYLDLEFFTPTNLLFMLKEFQHKFYFAEFNSFAWNEEFAWSSKKNLNFLQYLEALQPFLLEKNFQISEQGEEIFFYLSFPFTYEHNTQNLKNDDFAIGFQITCDQELVCCIVLKTDYFYGCGALPICLKKETIEYNLNLFNSAFQKYLAVLNPMSCVVESQSIEKNIFSNKGIDINVLF